MKLQASPVKLTALQHGVPVAQPLSLRLDGKYPQDAEQARAALQAAQPDVMVVAAYRPDPAPVGAGSAALGMPNIHASLLPRWRGAAPSTVRSEAGDTHTGITIMQMDAGLDTGAMCLHRSVGHWRTRYHRQPARPPSPIMGGQLIVQALQHAAGRYAHGHTPAGRRGDRRAQIEKHEAWAGLAAQRRSSWIGVLARFHALSRRCYAVRGRSQTSWAAQPEAAADVRRPRPVRCCKPVRQGCWWPAAAEPCA